MLRVGLIGFGTIGRAVADALWRGDVDGMALAAVFVRSRARLRPDDPVAYGDLFHDDFADFAGAGLDWAVEAGGHEALRQWGPRALAAGINLVALSVGALADTAFCDELVAAARAASRRVLVPSGGIGTLDVLSSAAVGRLDEVRLTTRKPPRALLPPDEAARVVASGRAELLYDGPAGEAARRFPENLNICAALALAGVGLDRTRVTVYADPEVERNTHHVTARGYFGDYEFTLRNVPSENPKTGRIVALSVVKTLRNLTRPLVVGG
ncbi:MAG TPA: aspartate dehydrogenase [Chloroflexota bacterium]|jgi:aspartate dehydrogenase|nr:aspartate dehydrogenase [Chloroflexota bacterium]